MKYANNLMKIRTRQGLSQKELGELSGIDPGTIRKLEKGLTKPHAETVHRLSKALSTSPSKIFPYPRVKNCSDGQMSFAETQQVIIPANDLNKLREAAGLSIEQVAKKLNTGESVVSLWETGDYHIPAKYMFTLCEIYNCTLEELVKAAKGTSQEESPQGESPEASVIEETVSEPMPMPSQIKRRSRDEEYTAEEIQLAREQGKTQGRKGMKALRINIAFEPVVHDYVVNMSQASGMSMTDFVNYILRKSIAANQELYERAQFFKSHIV